MHEQAADGPLSPAIKAASEGTTAGLGLNFANMPELKLAWGYPAALAIIAAACVFMWWRFRRAKWL